MVIGKSRTEGEEGEEEEINRDEIGEAIKRIKKGKATGSDGIAGEVWKFGGEELERWLRNFCNRVWKGEEWPKGWMEGEIVPIVKRGEGNRVQNYRGITLMASSYKIYAMVLAGRLKEEIESKGILHQIKLDSGKE